MPLTQEQKDALVDAALDVQQRAFAPYSGFRVGAAILDSQGDTFLGCNVENASYGLSICAERAAVCTMIAEGRQSIRAIAIASQGGVSPCGACRQFLIEFGADFDVLLIDSKQQQIVKTWEMAKLLPGAFHFDKEGRLPAK